GWWGTTLLRLLGRLDARESCQRIHFPQALGHDGEIELRLDAIRRGHPGHHEVRPILRGIRAREDLPLGNLQIRWSFGSGATASQRLQRFPDFLGLVFRETPEHSALTQYLECKTQLCLTADVREEVTLVRQQLSELVASRWNGQDRQRD